MSKEKSKLVIIAGPCSISKENLGQVYEIADISVDGKRVIAGTRVVGLKSRTEYDPTGNGMGIDRSACLENMKKVANGGELTPTPSSEMIRKVVKETGMTVATEIMMPLSQIPVLVRSIAEGKLLLWNPSVNQLGWHLFETAALAAQHNHWVGIKNGKWIGAKLSEIRAGRTKEADIIRTWIGLDTYVTAQTTNRFLINRGFPAPGKGLYRAAPAHKIAEKVKLATGAKLLFDPSHSHGPKMRDEIVDNTAQAMGRMMSDGTYLYDGILIEAGKAETDSLQHITLEELRELAQRLAEFRDLVTPEEGLSVFKSD